MQVSAGVAVMRISDMEVWNMMLQHYAITYMERYGMDDYEEVERDNTEEVLYMLSGKYPCNLEWEERLILYKAIKRYLLNVGAFSYAELVIAWNSKLTDLWDCSNELESILREVA